MSDDRTNRLRAVYAQLEALAEDLPPIAFDQDAKAYNSLVDELIDLDILAQQFRIGDEDLFREVISTNRLTGEKRCHDIMQVHHHVLDRKVKSLLKIFRLTTDTVIVEVDLPRTSTNER